MVLMQLLSTVPIKTTTMLYQEIRLFFMLNFTEIKCCLKLPRTAQSEKYMHWPGYQLLLERLSTRSMLKGPRCFAVLIYLFSRLVHII
jgi:hypothetical protein